MKKKNNLKSKILLGTGIFLAISALGLGICQVQQLSGSYDVGQNSPIKLSDEKIISTDLVLYENGRGFISQTRQVQLDKGLQEINLGDVPETLILSSAAVSGKDIQSQSINFDPRFDKKTYYEVAQEESVGKDVVLIWTVWKEGEKSEIKQKAKLLDVENGVPVLLIDGLVHKGTDARILYPELKKDIENKKIALDFSIISQTDKPQEITFSYLAEGFRWNTNYNVYLDEDKNLMSLKGYVQLNNNTKLDYKNANIDFVLGEINTIMDTLPIRQKEATCQIDNKPGIKNADDPITVNGKTIAENTKEMELEYPMISESGHLIAYSNNRAMLYDEDGNIIGHIKMDAEVLDLKDYYVYRIPFKTNLKQGQPLTALFLDKDGLKYQKEYTFSNPVSFQYTTNVKNMSPNLQIIFQNDADSGIGMPLPKGNFHVFNNKGNGSFFIGESSVSKTVSLGQRAVVNVGKALDVYADIKEINHKKISDEQKEYTYQMDIKNISKESKKINIKQILNSSFSLKESSIPLSENIPSLLAWEISLPPFETKTFTFSVLYTDWDLIEKKQEVELEKQKLAAEEARLEAEREYQRLKLKR